MATTQTCVGMVEGKACDKPATVLADKVWYLCAPHAFAFVQARPATKVEPIPPADPAPVQEPTPDLTPALEKV